MDDFPTLLGHGSVKPTERYYAPWKNASLESEGRESDWDMTENRG